MNLVSSHFKIKNLTLLTISYFSLAFTAFGQECSTVHFQPLELDNTNYVAKIIGHNGVQQEYSYSERKLINSSDYSYNLEPGEHSLNIAIVPKLTARNLREMKYANKRVLSLYDHDSIVQSRTVSLSAKANTIMHINFSKIGKEILPAVMKIEQKKCDISEGEALPSRNLQNDSREVSANDLPVDIEYRLRQLMTKIRINNKDNSRDFSSNILPVMGANIFGVTVDSEFADNGNALKVLSVLPYSQASKMNFLSGDIITYLGNDQVVSKGKNPTQVFTDYLNTLRIGDILDIRVKRNTGSIHLKETFIPEMLPESSYHIFSNKVLTDEDRPLINYTELPEILKFEYEQLLLEIFNYYSKKNLPLESISLTREPLIDNRFGMTGNTINTTNYYGVVITSIDIGGGAEKLGLSVGDDIVKVNNNSLNQENVNNLIESLTHLKPGQVFSVTINRKGKSIVLKGEYKPIYFTAFNLDINLKSKAEAEDRISEIILGNENYNDEFSRQIGKTRYLNGFFRKGNPSETIWKPKAAERRSSTPPNNGKK